MFRWITAATLAVLFALVSVTSADAASTELNCQGVWMTTPASYPASLIQIPYCDDALTGERLKMRPVVDPQHGELETYLDEYYTYTPDADATHDRIGFAPTTDGEPVWLEIGIDRPARPTCATKPDVRLRPGKPRTVYLYCPNATSWRISDSQTLPADVTLNQYGGDNANIALTPTGESGVGSISLIASNDEGDSAPLVIEVQAGADVNTPPRCSASFHRILPGQRVALYPPCSDADDDPLTYGLGTPPAIGQVTGDPATDGGWVFTAPKDITETTTSEVAFSATDGHETANNRFRVEINPDRENAAPSCPFTDQTTEAESPHYLYVACADPNGDLVDLSLGNAKHGSVSLINGILAEFTPEAGYVGDEASYDVTWSDGIAETTATVRYTVTAPPVSVQITDGPPSHTKQRSASIAFEGSAKATFTCKLDDGEASPCTSPFKTDGLEDGEHVLQVVPTAYGTTGDAASRTWTVDTTPPGAPTITHAPDAVSLDTWASFGFGGVPDADAFECRLDAEESFSPCGFWEDLSAGRHTLVVRAVDQAGNVGTQTTSFDWRVLPADTQVLDLQPGKARGASTERMAAFVTLPDGGRIFALQPTDPVADSPSGWRFASDSREIIIPTAAADEPAEIMLLVDVDALRADVTSETLGVAADGVPVAPCAAAGSAATPDPCFSARERNSSLAGIVVRTTHGAVFTLLEDAGPQPPTLSIDDGPTRTKESAASEVTFHGTEGATFTCKLDGGAAAACTSPYAVPAQGHGEHTVEVTPSKDGLTGTAASHTWWVDLQAPPTPQIYGPDALTHDTTAWFSAYSETGAQHECKVDDEAEFGDCSREDLALGDHTVTVHAIDWVGNVSQASTYAWRIVPQDMQIAHQEANESLGSDSGDRQASGSSPVAGWIGVGAPVSPVGDPPAGWAFAGSAIEVVTPPASADAPGSVSLGAAKGSLPAGVTAKTAGIALDGARVLPCRTDGPGPAPCIVAMADTGTHLSVQVATLGGAGVWTWLKDDRAPVTTLAGDPKAFTFTADEDGSTFECSLDAAAFAACATAPGTASLKPGKHTFRVRAIDPTGNVGEAANHEWTVQAADPDPTPTPTATPTATATPRPTVTATATPQSPVKTGTTDTVAPKLALRVKTTRLRRTVRSVVVSPGCDEDCTALVTVTVDGRTAKRLKLSRKAKRVEVGRAIGDGRRPVRVPLHAALLRVKRVRFAIVVRAADGVGNRSTVTRRVTLTR